MIPAPAHLLVVTPDFPPLGSPQAYQSARLVKALALAGFKITVIARSVGGERKEFHHASEFYERLPASVIVRRFERDNFPRSSLGRRIYRYFMPSDPNCEYRSLRRCLRLAAADVEIDGVISVAEPLVSHLAVQRTRFPDRMRFRCFWFSDPVPMSRDAQTMRFKWRRLKCEAISRTALLTGDCIVGVTAEIIEPIMQLAPSRQNNCLVLPHVYDPEDWAEIASHPKREAGKNTVICIVHAGALYWKRTPFSLIEGIRILCQENFTFRAELILQGGMSLGIEAQLSSLSPPCAIHIQGPKSYSDSKAAIAEADILCIIDVELDRNIHLPSKIADYVGARKPIIYIGQPDAPVVRALRNHPAFAQARSPSEVATALKALIDRRSRVRFSDYETVCSQFDLHTAYEVLTNKIINHEPSC